MAQDAPPAFFSYCREDSDFALRLAGDLKATGASVWLDQLDIIPGERWDRAVEDALASCPRMLVILSPASVNSTNVMDEVSFALEEKKSVIPVIYKDCAIPFRLRRVQYVDFRQDYARGLTGLLKTLAPAQRPGQSGAADTDVVSESEAEVTEADKREHAAQGERPKAAQEQRQAAEQARADKERKLAAQQARPQDVEAWERSEVNRTARREPEEDRAKTEGAREDRHWLRKWPTTWTRQRTKVGRGLMLGTPAAALAAVLLIGFHLLSNKTPTKGLLTLTGHSGRVFSVAWSPDGKLLATGSEDNTAKVWDVGMGKELLTLSGYHSTVASVAWRPDGKRVATGSFDQTASVWDAETGRELLRLRGHLAAVYSVAWSPDGRRLATGGNDDTAKVWDAETGKELMTLTGHSGLVWSVAWSPDGKRLATGSGKTATVWDTETGAESLSLRGHDDYVRSVAWSPDGKRLATGSEDRTAKVWDAGSGNKLLSLDRDSGEVLSVAWNPDGKRLATGNGVTASVWDGGTGEELLTLSGHRDWVSSVAWNHTGDRLATGSGDNTVKVWDVGN